MPFTDRVQSVVFESAAKGGDAADNFISPAELDPQEDALEAAGYIVQDATNRDEAVFIDRNGNDLRFFDISNPAGVTLTDVIAGVGALTEAAHKALRQLIHFINDGPAESFASGAFKEVTGGFFPTSRIWWESTSKLKKIVEKTITRSGGGATNVKPTPIEWKMYDTDGSTVLVTVSDAITYSGIAEVSRIRTIT